MAEIALTFKQVKGRLKFIDVSYCEPWGDGKGYFVGPDTSNRPNDYPYATGPRCFVGRHSDGDIIPLEVIHNWLHQLGILGDPLTTFWAIEEHQSPSV